MVAPMEHSATAVTSELALATPIKCSQSCAERANQLISVIQPGSSSLTRRKQITEFMQRVVSECFHDSRAPVHLVQFGSVPLRTFLPDGDIDLSIMSTDASLKDVWAQKLYDHLGEVQMRHSAPFQITNVQIILAEVRLLKCLVDNIVVDISYHQLGGIKALCFLEEVNRIIDDHDHIFKKSIILVKAWCYYESRMLGAHHGLFSTYALEVLVLYVFNLYHKFISSPIEVLYLFLLECGRFDWDNYCLCIKGRIALNSFPDYTVEAVPVAEPLLTPEVEAECLRRAVENEILQEVQGGHMTPPSTPSAAAAAAQNQGAESNASNTSAGSTAVAAPAALPARPGPAAFLVRFMNIQDPLQPTNNVARSVTKSNMHRVRKAFAYGASVLAGIMTRDDCCPDLDDFFKNVWNAQRSGRYKIHQDTAQAARDTAATPSDQQLTSVPHPPALPAPLQQPQQGSSGDAHVTQQAAQQVKDAVKDAGTARQPDQQHLATMHQQLATLLQQQQQKGRASPLANGVLYPPRTAAGDLHVNLHLSGSSSSNNNTTAVPSFQAGAQQPAGSNQQTPPAPYRPPGMRAQQAQQQAQAAAQQAAAAATSMPSTPSSTQGAAVTQSHSSQLDDAIASHLQQQAQNTHVGGEPIHASQDAGTRAATFQAQYGHMLSSLQSVMLRENLHRETIQREVLQQTLAAAAAQQLAADQLASLHAAVQQQQHQKSGTNAATSSHRAKQASSEALPGSAVSSAAAQTQQAAALITQTLNALTSQSQLGVVDRSAASPELTAAGVGEADTLHAVLLAQMQALRASQASRANSSSNLQISLESLQSGDGKSSAAVVSPQTQAPLSTSSSSQDVRASDGAGGGRVMQQSRFVPPQAASGAGVDGIISVAQPVQRNDQVPTSRRHATSSGDLDALKQGAGMASVPSNEDQYGAGKHAGNATRNHDSAVFNNYSNNPMQHGNAVHSHHTHPAASIQFARAAAQDFTLTGLSPILPHYANLPPPPPPAVAPIQHSPPSALTYSSARGVSRVVQNSSGPYPWQQQGTSQVGMVTDKDTMKPSGQSQGPFATAASGSSQNRQQTSRSNNHANNAVMSVPPPPPPGPSQQHQHGETSGDLAQLAAKYAGKQGQMDSTDDLPSAAAALLHAQHAQQRPGSGQHSRVVNNQHHRSSSAAYDQGLAQQQQQAAMLYELQAQHAMHSMHSTTPDQNFGSFRSQATASRTGSQRDVPVRGSDMGEANTALELMLAGQTSEVWSEDTGNASRSDLQEQGSHSLSRGTTRAHMSAASSGALPSPGGQQLLPTATPAAQHAQQALPSGGAPQGVQVQQPQQQPSLSQQASGQQTNQPQQPPQQQQQVQAQPAAAVATAAAAALQNQIPGSMPFPPQLGFPLQPQLLQLLNPAMLQHLQQAPFNFLNASQQQQPQQSANTAFLLNATGAAAFPGLSMPQQGIAIDASTGNPLLSLNQFNRPGLQPGPTMQGNPAMPVNLQGLLLQYGVAPGHGVSHHSNLLSGMTVAGHPATTSNAQPATASTAAGNSMPSTAAVLGQGFLDHVMAQHQQQQQQPGGSISAPVGFAGSHAPGNSSAPSIPPFMGSLPPPPVLAQQLRFNPQLTLATMQAANASPVVSAPSPTLPPPQGSGTSQRRNSYGTEKSEAPSLQVQGGWDSALMQQQQAPSPQLSSQGALPAAAQPTASRYPSGNWSPALPVDTASDRSQHPEHSGSSRTNRDAVPSRLRQPGAASATSDRNAATASPRLTHINPSMTPAMPDTPSNASTPSIVQHSGTSVWTGAQAATGGGLTDELLDAHNQSIAQQEAVSELEQAASVAGLVSAKVGAAPEQPSAPSMLITSGKLPTGLSVGSIDVLSPSSGLSNIPTTAPATAPVRALPRTVEAPTAAPIPTPPRASKDRDGVHDKHHDKGDTGHVTHSKSGGSKQAAGSRDSNRQPASYSAAVLLDHPQDSDATAAAAAATAAPDRHHSAGPRHRSSSNRDVGPDHSQQHHEDAEHAVPAKPASSGSLTKRHSAGMSGDGTRPPSGRSNRNAHPATSVDNAITHDATAAADTPALATAISSEPHVVTVSSSGSLSGAAASFEKLPRSSSSNVNAPGSTKRSSHAQHTSMDGTADAASTGSADAEGPLESRTSSGTLNTRVSNTRLPSRTGTGGLFGKAISSVLQSRQSTPKASSTVGAHGTGTCTGGDGAEVDKDKQQGTPTAREASQRSRLASATSVDDPATAADATAAAAGAEAASATATPTSSSGAVSRPRASAGATRATAGHRDDHAGAAGAAASTQSASHASSSGGGGSSGALGSLSQSLSSKEGRAEGASRTSLQAGALKHLHDTIDSVAKANRRDGVTLTTRPSVERGNALATRPSSSSQTSHQDREKSSGGAGDGNTPGNAHTAHGSTGGGAKVWADRSTSSDGSTTTSAPKHVGGGSGKEGGSSARDGHASGTAKDSNTRRSGGGSSSAGLMYSRMGGPSSGDGSKERDKERLSFGGAVDAGGNPNSSGKQRRESGSFSGGGSRDHRDGHHSHFGSRDKARVDKDSEKKSVSGTVEFTLKDEDFPSLG